MKPVFDESYKFRVSKHMNLRIETLRAILVSDNYMKDES
mgnify:FL=1